MDVPHIQQMGDGFVGLSHWGEIFKNCNQPDFQPQNPVFERFSRISLSSSHKIYTPNTQKNDGFDMVTPFKYDRIRYLC